MAEEMVTGYEARFDFPHFQGQRRPYLFASVPRTGSTYLSHLLWKTGCMGAPLEYLNFDPAGPYGHASELRGEQERLWRAALDGRTSPNGLFGIKVFPIQFEWLFENNPQLVDQAIRTLLPGPALNRVVQLRRRDRDAHLISYARAILSGVWRKEQEGLGLPPAGFDRKAIDFAASLIDRQEETWRQMFRDLRIEPLVVWYEDVVAQPREAVEAIARYLGVVLDPGAAVTIPAIERQSQEGVSEWSMRLREGG